MKKILVCYILFLTIPNLLLASTIVQDNENEIKFDILDSQGSWAPGFFFPSHRSKKFILGDKIYFFVKAQLGYRLFTADENSGYKKISFGTGVFDGIINSFVQNEIGSLLVSTSGGLFLLKAGSGTPEKLYPSLQTARTDGIKVNKEGDLFVRSSESNVVGKNIKYFTSRDHGKSFQKITENQYLQAGIRTNAQKYGVHLIKNYGKGDDCILKLNSNVDGVLNTIDLKAALKLSCDTYNNVEHVDNDGNIFLETIEGLFVFKKGLKHIFLADTLTRNHIVKEILPDFPSIKSPSKYSLVYREKDKIIGKRSYHVSNIFIGDKIFRYNHKREVSTFMQDEPVENMQQILEVSSDRGKSFTPLFLDDLIDDVIIRTTAIKNRFLIVSTAKNKYFVIDAIKNKTRKISIGLKINQIRISENSDILYGTNNGLYLIKGNEWATDDIMISSLPTKSIVNFRSGKVLILDGNSQYISKGSVVNK